MFSKMKKFNEKDWHFSTVLQISLMSGLIEDSWILISASAFSLGQHRMSWCFWKTLLYTYKSIKSQMAF